MSGSVLIALTERKNHPKKALKKEPRKYILKKRYNNVSNIIKA